MTSITLYSSTSQEVQLANHIKYTLNLNSGIGLSDMDELIQRCRYFPDGTKKRLKAGQPIDKRRDTTYQMVQAVVYKYNDHHNLIGVCSLSSLPPASLCPATRIALCIISSCPFM